MTDLTAAPETPSTVIDNDAPAPGSAEYRPEAIAPEPIAKAKPMSLEDAVKQAASETKDNAAKTEEPKAEPKEAKPKVESKVEPKPEKVAPERGENGKFTAKPQAEQEPSGESRVGAEGEQERGESRPSEVRDINRAPAHFLPRAKEAWAGVNEDVRAAVIRMEANFEKGKEAYEEDRVFRKELREFDDMAKQHGTTVKAALANYTAIDNELKTNPASGIERILLSVGITPQQYAQHIMGQEQQRQENPQQHQANQINQTVQQLQSKIDQMEARDRDRAQQEATRDEIAKVENGLFADIKRTPGYERFDELRSDIALFWNSDKIPSTLSERERLEAAYDMAERINPIGHVLDNEPLSPAPNAQRPLNPAGSKSVKGSLSYGAEAPRKSAKLSLDEAIKMAARAVNG